MNTGNTHNKSWSEKLMEAMGYRQVPEFKLQVIKRNGRFHRAVGDPFVRISPFSESFGDQIDIGVQVVERDYRNVMSRDGVPHRISVNVKIKFDLRDADPELAPAIVKNGSASVGNRAAGLVDLALRREIGNLTSAQILRPGLPEALETAIRKRLRGMEKMGATLLPIDDSVVVKEVTPPERVQESRNETTTIDETISSLSHLQREQIKQALVAHLLRDIGQHGVEFKNLWLPEDLNPTAPDPKGDAYRVMRQPTGRIYDN